MNETISYLAQRASDGVRARKKALAGERGQGTVEYVALVTLVAVVMFGVITAIKSAKLAEGQELAMLLVKKIEDAVKQIHY